jgi:hypothetical protein
MLKAKFPFFSGGSRGWTPGFALAKQVLYHLSHSASPFCIGFFFFFFFCIGYFEIESSLMPGFVLDCDPPICAFPHRSDDRHMPPCLAIGWDMIFQTFYLVWPETAVLWISASKVTRIIDYRFEPLCLVRIYFCWEIIHNEKSSWNYQQGDKVPKRSNKARNK